MDYGLRNLNAGISKAVGTFGNLGSIRQDAYDQALTAGATGRQRLMQARKAQEEAARLYTQNAALANAQDWLGDAMAANHAGELTPEMVASYANLLRASDGGNFQQLVGGLGGLLEQGQQAHAARIYKDDPTQANAWLAASGRKPYEPFQANASGAVLNQTTGEMDLGNDMAAASMAAIRALTGQRNASAANSIGSRDKTRTEIAGTLPPGPSAHKPTNAMKQYQELTAMGVDPKTALVLAYGDTIERVQDPMGMSTRWIDTSSGEVVFELDAKGNMLHNAARASGGASAPATPAGSAGKGVMVLPPTTDDPLGIRDLLGAPK
ncbi:MAG: hypothetical protein KDK91_20355 [Gammaproteobacteria bacterium]|nr:hypothetical protein [Gammaproteobacteria bacterium]